MSRPSFQFYHGDWRSNAKLRRCTRAERGDWIDAMCLLADSDEFGMLRWPLKDLAQAVGCPVSSLQALRDKEVLKGADKGEGCPPFIYIPRHGGKDGAPVILIPEQTGPIWYSSRMVRDEYIRSIRGEGTRFGAEPKGAEKHKPKPPIGDESSTGSTASSPSSSPASEKQKAEARASRLPADWALPEQWLIWTRTERTDWPIPYVRGVADQFRDYWVAKPGKDGTKLDWEATWRNWIRREKGPQVARAAGGGKQTALEQHNLSVAEGWKPPETANANR